MESRGESRGPQRTADDGAGRGNTEGGGERKPTGSARSVRELEAQPSGIEVVRPGLIEDEVWDGLEHVNASTPRGRSSLPSVPE